jgi:radical SAM superfamily enzyme YgiQ (UPF0313 family)
VNVLLVNPPTPAYMPNKEFMLSTALLSLAAVLRADGVDVRIEDLNVGRPWEAPGSDGYREAEGRVGAAIDGFRPDLVGIGCLFSGQFPSVMRYAGIAKERAPGVPVAVGGMHPTIYAREILRNCASIDYVAIGEGESQIVAIARAVRGDAAPFRDVDGLAWREGNDVVVRSKTRFLADLSALPMPAYDLIRFSDYEHDTSHWHNPGRLSFRMTIPVVSSRSCPMRCNFCSMFLVMGPALRARSPESVVDELELLYHRYGQRHFSFMDDNINLNRKHVIALCRGIVQRKLRIAFETPNGLMASSLDREVMDAMVAAGWVRGAIAIESGSDRIRNGIMKKRLSREKIFEVVRLAKAYPQLFLKAYFLIGMPEDTAETLEETYEMIREIDVDDPYVTNLIPFPGTAVFAQSLRDGLFVDELVPGDLWRMDGFHYHNNRKFYIKPYEMTMEELDGYREKFDRLLAERKAKRTAGHPEAAAG